jgi:hypothetical protein
VVARIFITVAVFVCGMIGASWILIASHNNGFVVVFPPGESHVEVLTLVLAAATLVITAVAMMLAIAAVGGYTAIKDAASAAGKSAGEDAARELLADLVQREVAARLAARGPDRTEELAEALAERGNDAGTTQN